MRFSVLALLALSLISSSPAQQVAQAAPALTPAAGNTWSLTWQGVPGRTYFIQCSPDLQQWVYAQDIIAGQGLPISFGLSCPGNRMFVRLAFSDIPTSDPASADFDNDGLSNYEELNTYFTDPLNFDSDGDHLKDGEEVANQTNANSSDSDGDGFADNHDNNANQADDPTELDELVAAFEAGGQYAVIPIGFPLVRKAISMISSSAAMGP